MEAPKLFISYSWSNATHEKWVIDLASELMESGVDVILDMVGGDYIERNIKSLAPDGRLVQIAFQKSPKVEVNMMPVMLKRLTLTGSTLRPQQHQYRSPRLPVSKQASRFRLRPPCW